MTYQITFLPSNITVDAKLGESLLDIAQKADLYINATCGGAGTCGRCKVVLKEGSVESPKGNYLSEEEYKNGQRLACCSKANNNATIEIPIESLADDSTFRASTAVKEEKITLTEIDPLVKDYVLTLEKPSHMNNQSDLTRVLDALAAQHHIKHPHYSYNFIKKLSKILRNSDFKVKVSIFSELFSDGNTQNYLVSVRPADDIKSIYGLSIDVGTTTVWGRLANLTTGETTDATGELNNQISHGEDIISRIIYSTKGDGLEKLQKAVIENINNLIKKLTLDNKQIKLVIITGNTTMCHLLMGLDSNSIRLSPYVPCATFWPTLSAKEININVSEDAILKICPSVSSYVGSDIVSGVLASGLYTKEEITLFIDVGTNGEIVIGNNSWLTCAACSAGPAFEGGGVKFGMRAAPGAIDDFKYNQETKTHTYHTIGDKKVLGICGSGLINIAAELFRAGVLNSNGKFNQDLNLENIRKQEYYAEYVLVPAKDAAGDKDVVLTEIDIENLIRAKGAMFSGYQTLLESVGLTMQDLDKIIIAGGFGKSLNIENAITIGFLPDVALEKITYIGNGALTGATLSLLSKNLWLQANNIKANITNFELSETPGYMDYYMGSLFIPHTNFNLFPSVIKKNKK